jgi:hypothetical protein
MRGMSRNPKDRPASAGELVSRLSEALAPLTAPAEPATPAPQPQPAPSVAPPPPRRNRDPRLRLAAALIPLIALAIAVAAIAASTGSGPSSHTRTTAARSRPTATTRSHPTATTRSRPTATTRSAPAAHAAPPTHSSAAASAAPLAAPSAATGGPASAVERFYALAAGHQYAAAWALTDPAFQRQLGGYRSFQYTVAADRSIAFDSVRTVSQSPDAAVVAVRTTSFRTDGTQHCAGTVQLVPDGRGAWLLHQIAIGCS